MTDNEDRGDGTAEITVTSSSALAQNSASLVKRGLASLSSSEMSKILEACKALASARTEREVLGILRDKVNQLLQSDSWSLLLMDEKEELYLKFAAGKELNAEIRERKAEDLEELKDLRIKLGQGIVGWVWVDPISSFQKDLSTLQALGEFAAIGFKNARLFSEEQKKSRQLSLINTVSKHAITTRDPDEMLSKITLEIEKELHYDHIGIATLDYSAKELIVQAEAGTRREALGLHIPLGEGLVGHVARTGEAAAIREAGPATPRTVLPGSAASLALPVIYAEQLLGVLYVECPQPREFGDQEIQLMQTLADVFAGALHNALTFQKAQEQAITDRVTGLKSERFLMEALSAECRRSARANRVFSVVALDIDSEFVKVWRGRQGRDDLLREIGNKVETIFWRSDVLGHLGFGEFFLLLPETSKEQACLRAEELHRSIKAATWHPPIYPSIGVATYPDDGSTPQELIKRVYEAVDLAKHSTSLDGVAAAGLGMVAQS